MSKSGSESRFLSAGGAKVLPQAIQRMNDQMIVAIQAGALVKAMKKLISALSVATVFTGGRDRIYGIMAGLCPRKQCTIPTTILQPWVKDIIVILDTQLCNCFECSCTADAIPLPTFQRMMEEKDQYAIMNDTQGYGMHQWLTLHTNATVLKDHFQLTQSQYDKVREWLKNASTSEALQNKVFPILNDKMDTKYQVKQWSDLPYRQWLRADVLAKLKEISDPIVSVTPEAPFEFPFFLKAQQGNLPTNGQTPESLGWSLATVQCMEKVECYATFNIHYYNIV
jgi:hypothetical protein